MIVCSCNVFSDAQVRAVIAASVERPRISRIYSSLGRPAQCGRCAHTIKSLIEQSHEHPAAVRLPQDCARV